MKTPRFAAILVLAAAIASVAASQSVVFTVRYVEGDVEVLKGSSWSDVDLGAKLAFDATVRVAKASFLEYTDGRIVITISAEGSYRLDAIYQKALALQKGDAGVLDKLKSLTSSSSDANAVVMAVRGSSAAATGSGFSYDDEGEASSVASRFEEALRLSRGGDRGSAIQEFLAVVLTGQEPWASTAAYFAAMLYVESGMPARAISLLRSFGPKPGMAAYGLCVLALARLDAESGAVDEAKALLSAAIASGVLSADELDLARKLLASLGS